MVALRDGLRWATEGAWVQDLPPVFQWLGLTQAAYPLGRGALVGLADRRRLAWALRHLAAGRAIYATGSNADAARLAGLDTARVKTSVFAAAGALTGLAALLNAVRFNQIPSNAGLGLEMKVIAAGRRRRRARSPAAGAATFARHVSASSCSARSVRR